jgi:hypothetical protein
MIFQNFKSVFEMKFKKPGDGAKTPAPYLPMSYNVGRRE